MGEERSASIILCVRVQGAMGAGIAVSCDLFGGEELRRLEASVYAAPRLRCALSAATDNITQITARWEC
jgi:hypothetical protein